MKIRLSLLKKFITLPSNDPQEIRFLFDDVGLEVKDIEEATGDWIYNIETLANRGDHLYALGLARELSGRLLTQVNLPVVAGEIPDKPVSVVVRNNTDKCLRYSLLELSLPEFLDLRPEVAAMFPGGSGNDPIVDYINYIQMELGQPMHVFDRDKVDSEMIVELSQKEEEVIALSGKKFKVPAGSIIIRDRRQIIDVAGITGLANTMVTSATRRILVEAATFDPVCVRKTAKKMGISTDASYAFERGVDPENILFALRRLVYLTQGSGGALSAAGTQILGFTYLRGTPLTPRKIKLSTAKLKEQVCSPRLSEVEVTSRLKALGFMPTLEEKYLNVTVPSWRIWDVFNDDDIIEEFCKAYSFNNIKLQLPPLDYEFQLENEREALQKRIEPILHGNGFIEVVTSSFSSNEDLLVLDELMPGSLAKHVKVANAVEGKYASMKFSNVINMTRTAMQNMLRDIGSFKAYELCRIFADVGEGDKAQGAEVKETDTISLAMCGRWYNNDWRKPESTEELLSLFKGVVGDIFAANRTHYEVVASKHPFLHPGKQAAIKAGKNVIATFGVVHPRIGSYLELKHTVLYAEIAERLLIEATGEYILTQPSDFPASSRDVTLRVPQNFAAVEIQRLICKQQVDDLVHTRIVDSFQKQGEDFRRVTYRLSFQNSTRTLENAEVDQSIQRILGALKSAEGIEQAV